MIPIRSGLLADIGEDAAPHIGCEGHAGNDQHQKKPGDSYAVREIRFMQASFFMNMGLSFCKHKKARKHKTGNPQNSKNGDPEGARTLDLQRDRLAF